MRCRAANVYNVHTSEFKATSTLGIMKSWHFI
jgi:hypothetical protein